MPDTAADIARELYGEVTGQDPLPPDRYAAVQSAVSKGYADPHDAYCVGVTDGIAATLKAADTLDPPTGLIAADLSGRHRGQRVKVATTDGCLEGVIDTIAHEPSEVRASGRASALHGQVTIATRAGATVTVCGNAPVNVIDPNSPAT